MKRMKTQVRTASIATTVILVAVLLTNSGSALAQNPLTTQSTPSLSQNPMTMQNSPFSNSETNGNNQDLYAVRGAKIEPGGTSDDPENLARFGYNQRAIRNLYKMRSIDRYCHEAQAVEKKGDLDGALTLFLQTLELDKQIHGQTANEVLAGLADIYMAKGQNDKALEALRTCVYSLGRPMGQEETLAKYALLLYQAGQIDEALTIYRLALVGLPLQQNDPIGDLPVDETNAGTMLFPFAINLILARCGLGGDYYYGNAEDAVKYARAAVKMRPTTAVGHYYLGLALQHLNDRDSRTHPELEKEAQSEYDRADELGSHELKKLVAIEPGRPRHDSVLIRQ